MSGLLMAILIILFTCSVNGQTEQVPGVIHIDALDPGEGKLSIPEAVALVSRAKMGVAIISPHDISEVSFGIPPLRNLLKVSEDQESIRTFGTDQYLAAVRASDVATPDVVAIAAAEAIPAYYWDGSIWNRPFIRNMHKHILVIGLTEPEDYDSIPSVSAGYSALFGAAHLVNVWPVVLLLSGVILVIYSRFLSRNGQPRSITPGVVLVLVGTVFTVNDYPFYHPYDAYHGDPGSGPYQAVIDYANDRDAMTFWAHPEVYHHESLPLPWPASIVTDSVYFETLPYTDDLLYTDGYTGFAIFEEGTHVIGIPGGIWDQTLIEYCAGVRKKPVWAIGEVDFEAGHAAQGINTSQTVFWVEERSQEGVLNALRDGAMYARRGVGNSVTIHDFRVSGSEREKVAHSGGQLTLTESPTITVDLDTGIRKGLTLHVIRSGKIIQSTQVTGETTVTVEDQVLGGEGTVFYRFVLSAGDWPVVVGNPIFVNIRMDALQRSQLNVEVSG